MKKILYILSLALIMTGCSIGKDMTNTPTKKVETYLNNYQTLDSNVLAKLDEIVDLEDTFDDNQKTTYRDLLKKHYQDLTYTIKEETVNGDKATVEVEIEVNDYTKALKSIEANKEADKYMDEEGKYDETKYIDAKLEALKESKERVKYTIYFSLTKSNNEWQLEDLTETEQEKLLGIYEY